MLARRDCSAVHFAPGLLAGAAAALGGAVLVQRLPVLPPPWFAAILGCAALVAIGACRRWHAPGWAWCLPIALAAFAWTTWRADLAMDARLPQALEKRDLLVVGRVDGLPRTRGDSTRFDFEVARAWFAGRSVAVHGHVRLSWYGTRRSGPPAIAACSKWRLRVRMKRPRGVVNPGGADFERSALQRGIIATGYVREDVANTMFGTPGCVDGIRARIADRIVAALPGDPHAARLLRALSVGDQRALDDHDWQVVRATGIAHLIAISGFHVGLAAVFGIWIVRLLWWACPWLGLRLARPLAEAAVAFPAALAYGALAGFGLPTTRTLLMIAVVAGWRLLRRGTGMGEGFGLALAAILLVDPLSVLSAGFWLSFAGAVFLVWTLAGASSRGRRLKEMGLAPLLMALALLPLTVWFFGQASLVGPLANLVAVPIVSFLIVPMDLAACLLLFAWPAAGGALLHVCAYAVDGLWWWLAHIAAWPLALQYFPTPSLWVLLLACLGAVWLLAPRGVPARALGAVLLLPLCWPPTVLPGQGAFTAVVIDVGQGLAVLVRTGGHALLFDTGARYPSGFDLGAVAVVPTLHAVGVARLDRLVISHGDNDHAGGAVSVLAAYPQARVSGGEPARGPVPMEKCRAGQQWQWDGVVFRMLRPPRGAGRVEGDNDAACVLLVTGAGGRLLLPADTSSRVEPAIARAVPPGPPLVLIVPHHGSKTSSSRAYLETLHPRLAIVSTGYLNGYHHPAPEVVARYRQLGIPLLDTSVSGAVGVAFPAHGAPHVAYRARYAQARYWRERSR